jgi:5'(3')-deoxyribonucleotidase
MKKIRIGVDQDWVLAKLTEKWVEYYNAIFDDTLNVKDIKTWNIIDFVKPEARDFMLNILIKS